MRGGLIANVEECKIKEITKSEMKVSIAKNVPGLLDTDQDDLTHIKFRYKGGIVKFPILHIVPMQKSSEFYSQEVNTCQNNYCLESAFRDPNGNKYYLIHRDAKLDKRLSLNTDRLKNYPDLLKIVNEMRPEANSQERNEDIFKIASDKAKCMIFNYNSSKSYDFFGVDDNDVNDQDKNMMCLFAKGMKYKSVKSKFFKKTLVLMDMLYIHFLIKCKKMLQILIASKTMLMHSSTFVLICKKKN